MCVFSSRWEWCMLESTYIKGNESIYYTSQGCWLQATETNSGWLSRKKKAFIGELWNSSRTFQHEWNQARKGNQTREALPQEDPSQNTSPNPPGRETTTTDPPLKNGSHRLPGNHGHRTLVLCPPCYHPLGTSAFSTVSASLCHQLPIQSL